MKRKNIVSVMFIMLMITLSLAYTNRTTISPNAHCADPPRYRHCGRCHVGGSGDVSAWFEGAPDTYSPGVTYYFTLHLTHPSYDIWGFQLIAKDDSYNIVGTLAPVDEYTFVTSGGYMNQTYSGCFDGVTGEVSWNVWWTAPSSNVGDITFYSSLTPCNNNDSDFGDLTVNITHEMTYMEGIEEPKPQMTELPFVEVYDIFGRKVSEGRFANIQNALPSGTYLIRDIDNEDLNKKITVVK